MTLNVESVRRLYGKTEGKSFENHPSSAKGEEHIRDLIAEGWLKKVDGRCGFEMIKDGMLKWTPAAHAAFSKIALKDEL